MRRLFGAHTVEAAAFVFSISRKSEPYPLRSVSQHPELSLVTQSVFRPGGPINKCGEFIDGFTHRDFARNRVHGSLRVDLDRRIGNHDGKRHGMLLWGGSIYLN